MYHEHFGFSEPPFSITPDPRFFYANSVYLEAYANLRYGIEAKRGFIAITGEVGTGKTMLLRKLMRELYGVIDFVFVVNTHLTFTELLRVILEDLCLQTQGKDRLGMLSELNAYLLGQLDRRRIVCLLIDEAQHLSDDCLEQLRLLSNFETDREKLLQVVLMGQPELKTRLDQSHLRQLKQRIAIHSEIAPLTAQEVGAYIDFRLRAAGYKGNDLFQPKTVNQIALYSKGIPRLINAVCDNALLIAFAASHKTVAASVISEVAKDLRLGLPRAGQTNQNHQFASDDETKTVLSRSEDKLFSPILRPILLATIAAIVGIVVAVRITGSLSDDDRVVKAPRSVPTDATMTEYVPLRSLQQSTAEKRDQEIANTDVKNNETDLQSLNEKRIIIPQGTTISGIANDVYGANAALGMDLIKELNPQINDLNWISAGQQLILPTLKGRTLLRQQPDGSYRLIISSFFTQTGADQLARDIRKEGYTVVITPNKASTGLSLHRVEIDGLRTLDDATQALETGLKNQWLGGKAPSGKRRTRADSPTLGTMPPQDNRRSERVLSNDNLAKLRNDRRVILSLEGRWYVNGDQEKRTEIVSSRGGMAARNERGQISRLELSSGGDVFAEAWRLRGDVRRDRIEWQNGTTWTREPVSRTAGRR